MFRNNILFAAAGSGDLSGIAIANNGGFDFWGQALNVGAVDVSAYEAR